MVLLKNFSLLFIFFILPFVSFSQQKTYKVVCDKKEKKLKVVESSNRSSDLVPVKSGFPFPALAREWIEDNYTTDDCDPDKLIDDIRQDTDDPSPGNAQQADVTSTPSTPVVSPTKQQPDYKNTSFGLDLLFHNLDKVLSLDESKLGMGLNLEHVFGKKNYFGTGAHFNVFVSEDNSEAVELYMFKFPFFVGTRTYTKGIFIAFEGGVFINTKLTSFSGEESDMQGLEPKGSSFSVFPRVRIGGKSMQFVLGAEIWLSEVFEGQDKLSVIHTGLSFSF